MTTWFIDLYSLYNLYNILSHIKWGRQTYGFLGP